MKEFVNEIAATITLPVGLDNGSLVDFETTGLSRDYGEYEIITLGYFEADQIVVIQRTCHDKAPFYEGIEKTIRGLSRPYYTYNSDFERELITSELGIHVEEEDFVDIMSPWREKAQQQGLKWPRLDELIGEPEDYFMGNHKICGRDIPGLWKTYLSTGSDLMLRMITEHCFSDILRETVLLGKYSLLTRKML